MKKRHVSKILFMLIMLVGFTTYSQNRVEGQIIDGELKETLPGANITIRGTNIGATSDMDGNFILNSTKEFPWVLQITYLGYATKQVSVSKNTSGLKVTLFPDANQLDVITVTANKRSQSSQKVAMAITSISPIKLQRTGVSNFKDYASGIPNLQFAPSGDGNSGRASSNVAIRGVSGANTTAMYLDETPLPENIDIRLMDVKRVEVLKGPQGTLYGSRNMGGAVKTITNQPTTRGFEGSYSMNSAIVKEGDIDYSTEFMLNIPLGEKLALRTSAFYDYESGIFDLRINPNATVRNKEKVYTYTGLDFDGNQQTIAINTDGCDSCGTPKDNIDSKSKYGFNIALAYKPTENLSIIPKVVIQRLKGDGYDFAQFEEGVFSPNSDRRFIQEKASGIPESFTDDWNFYTLTLKYDVEFGSFVSSTSYLDRNIYEKEDSGELTMRNFTFWDNIWNPSANKYNMWAYYMDREVWEKQINQELRFESKFGNNFEFTAGAFYNNLDYKTDWSSEEGGKGFVSYIAAAQWGDFGEANRQNTLPNDQRVPIYNYVGQDKSSEFALFGEFYYDIVDDLKFTLGLRYFSAKTEKDVYDYGYTVYDGVSTTAAGLPDYESSRTVIKNKLAETGVNPKFNLTYTISDSKLIYVNAAKGFRLGGVNDIVNGFLSWGELYGLGFRHESGYQKNPDGSLVIQTEPNTGEQLPVPNNIQEQIHPKSYGSDYLWNYELGFKGSWLNRKLITNVAFFYNDWNNLQQSIALASGYSYTTNVGNAKSYGLDLDLRYKVTRDLEISGGYGYLVAELSEDVPLIGAKKGSKILATAPHSGNFGLDYSKPINDTTTIYGNLNYMYVDKRFGSFNPDVDKHLIFGSYSILNLRAGVEINNFDISIFGSNLTDTFANYGTPNAFSGEIAGRPRYATNRPLTVGLELLYKFKN